MKLYKIKHGIDGYTFQCICGKEIWVSSYTKKHTPKPKKVFHDHINGNIELAKCRLPYVNQIGFNFV